MAYMRISAFSKMIRRRNSRCVPWSPCKTGVAGSERSCKVVSVLLVLSHLLWGLDVVQGVEVLAHESSLSPGRLDLIAGEWCQEQVSNGRVDDTVPFEDWPCSASWSERILPHSHGGEEIEDREHGGSQECLLSIVKSFGDSFILLPLVGVHTHF